MPFVHKIDIQQGNVITQEMVAQLQYGMDKKKVNFIMGSPIILDTFHSDRWDYLYTISRDGGKVRRRRITLFFTDDKLARVEGDVKPAAGRLVVDTRQDLTVDVPAPAAEGLISKLADTIPFVGEKEITEKSPKKAAAARVVEAEDALPTARKKSTKPTLTPIQRAAREEQDGPGVLAKLKQAMPFQGDAAAAEAGIEPAREAAEVDPPETEDAEASPGLLAKLKGAMPFTGDSSETPADGARDAEDDAVSDAEDGADDEAYAADEDAETDDEVGFDEEEEEARVVIAPPAAPTSMPLENQLAADPAPRRAADNEGIEVPAKRATRKRGFFARLFGRDRPATTEQPDNRERRRYRDIADPDSE